MCRVVIADDLLGDRSFPDGTKCVAPTGLGGGGQLRARGARVAGQEHGGARAAGSLRTTTPNRYRGTTHRQGECSYICGEEEEEIQRRSGACSQ